MRTPHRPKGFLSARYTPLVAALACIMVSGAFAQTPPPPTSPYIVTNTSDNLGVNPLPGAGTGTLRQAIVDANSRCLTGDEIRFAIPGTGPFVITPAAGLPPVSCSPLIDGTTQPGWMANSDPNGFNGTLMIAIDGTVAGAFGGCGLSFGGGTGTLKGVKVQNFTYGGFGVGICGSPTVMGSVIRNNGLGIDPSGSATIGGVGVAERNHIDSNALGGIITFGSNVIIRNNFITGNSVGVTLDCANNVQIRDNNVITANSGHGIWVGGSSNNSISDNKIDANAGNGILVGDGVECNGSNNNQIFNNKIASNGVNGVRVDGGTPSHVGNIIMGNSIHANSVKNINLNFDGGPLPNDAGDPDLGPNRLQNYPEPTAISYSGVTGMTTVTYTFDSLPGDYTLQAFENPSFDVKPAGQTLIAANIPQSLSSGPVTATFSVGGPRNNISMTATSISTGDSSELSQMIFIPAAPPAPNVTLSSTTMNFNDVDVGATSAEQKVFLFSSGSAAYRINAINSDPSCEGAPMCAAGDFICSTTCKPATDYAPGPACDFTGKFNPKSPGFATTTIYICDNTSTSPQSITLSGNGVTPSPIEIAPSRYDYGRVLVGGRSENTFMIINHASTEASLGPVTVNGADFTLASTTCGATLRPVSACYATVAFQPLQASTASGFLEVASARADLQGTGFQAAQLVLPASIDFGSFTLGSTSPLVQTIKLTNTGNAVLTFANVSVTGPFTLINECPLNLGPRESCFLKLEFRTTTVGEFAGVLNVVTNATDGSRAIALTAKSQPVPLPVIRVTPESIGFGNQVIGSTSPAQKITVKNEGGAVAALGTLTVSPDFVVISTTCGLTLEPGLTCFADVAMRPLGFGQRSGQLLVPNNAQGNPHAVNMVGTGCRPFSFGSNRGGGGLGCSP